MNASTIIALALVVVAFCLVLRSMLSGKSRGSCGGSCTGCNQPCQLSELREMAKKQAEKKSMM